MQESKALLDLREQPAELVAPYEKIDPRRVERLADEGRLKTPTIVTPVPDTGRYAILGGANRCLALQPLGAPVVVEKGYHVRVHGFIQSRDYEESLADFLKDARDAELPVPESLDPNELRAPRDTTEVIARRTMSQRNGSKR